MANFLLTLSLLSLDPDMLLLPAAIHPWHSLSGRLTFCQLFCGQRSGPDLATAPSTRLARFTITVAAIAGPTVDDASYISLTAKPVQTV